MERRQTTSRKFPVVTTKVTLKVATEAAAVWREGAGRCTSRARREIWTWFGCCWITDRWWTPLITSWNDLFILLFAVGHRCAPHSGRLSNCSVKTAPTSTLSTRRCSLVTFSYVLIHSRNLAVANKSRSALERNSILLKNWSNKNGHVKFGIYKKLSCPREAARHSTSLKMLQSYYAELHRWTGHV